MASDLEHRLLNALNDVANGSFTSIRQSAAYHSVPKSTLYDRIHGINPRTEARKSQRLLLEAQELVLIKWLEDLQRQVIPAIYPLIRSIVVEMLKANGQKATLGKHWITRFLARNPQLKQHLSNPMDQQRLKALNPTVVRAFFNEINIV